MKGLPGPQGLYDPDYEHDACGVGFICHIKGKASHKIVSDALQMLENMNHRGGCGCEPDSGDGAGILVRMPDKFFREKCARLGITLPPAGQYGVAHDLPPAGHGRAPRSASRSSRRSSASTGWSSSAGATCRSTASTSARRPKKTEPKIRQVFVGMGETFFNRPTSTAGCTSSASGPRTSIEFDESLPDARARGLLHLHPVGQPHRLQGHADGRPAPPVLHRPAGPGVRQRPGDRPLALQHEHVPELAAGAPVPLPRPQRRDQHAARQPQLDARAVRRRSRAKSSATSCRRCSRS